MPVPDENPVTVEEIELGRRLFSDRRLSRKLARTAPHMHDGSPATVEDVLDFYDGGGTENPGLDREIKPLSLTGKEKRHLEAFRRSLSGRITER